MNGRKEKTKYSDLLLLPPLSALRAPFPMNGRNEKTKYSDLLLLPFMGEMARGQRGRDRGGVAGDHIKLVDSK
ncbi:MAG: hypothetical protein CVV49_07065 [Spirochaetae bacterium HGW-Spirochaetae-5]|nr:MAG: hypothetical protein CVV49_07065 [Spirochaetae bacterium HGW-Spirochaetae-5]